MGLAKDLAVSFKNLGWRLSGPGDLFGFKLLRASSTSSSVTLQVLSEFAIVFLYVKFGNSSSFSLVKTEAKKLFKISHFSLSILVSSPLLSSNSAIPSL